MWEDLIYTKAQAKYRFMDIEADPENAKPQKIKSSFKSLRKKIMIEKQKLLNDDTIKVNSYYFDLYMGLQLYDVLKEEYAFTDRLAAQDELWRYLSLEVLSDLVYERVGPNDTRFYAVGRRIWLKRIWWYIHLSWQGTTEKTFEILKANTSDEILQLVDRTGSGGYRLDLTREIMFQHNMCESKKSRFLRRILKLNVARLKIIEPNLVAGGKSVYVKELYGYFKSDTSKT